MEIWNQIFENIKRLKGEGLFRGKYTIFQNEGKIILEVEPRRSEIVLGFVEIHVGLLPKDCYFVAKGKEDKIYPLAQYKNNIYEFTKEAVAIARQGKLYQRSMP